MPTSDRYRQFLRHYDKRRQRGPDPAAATRLRAMLGVLAERTRERVELVDFACGAGELLHLARAGTRPVIDYRGVALSEAALRQARMDFPEARFSRLDITAAGSQWADLAADCILVDDLFTTRGGLDEAAMWELMTLILDRLWPLAHRAIAFNIMTGEAAAQSEDGFRVSLDRLSEWLYRRTGRRVTFRADYGLEEYTCYLFKEPPEPAVAAPTPSTAADARMVCRPLLPAAAAILPYLADIDRRRWYSNFGHSVRALTSRLAAHFGLAESRCVTASSGTAALAAALIAVAGRATDERPYCLMPSYTFVGTPAAALSAGYKPYFADIDADSWALDPDRVVRHPMLREAGAIIVVAPYGKPIAQREWHQVAAATGVPVVIDAAAGFDAVAVDPAATLGPVPVVLSLHATKVFGVGEGGLVLCPDAELSERVVEALNFGFVATREAAIAGFNGKMSEYHAAVGLAALDAWPTTRAGFLRVAEAYRRAARRCGLTQDIIAEPGWASCYALYGAPSAAAATSAGQRLTAAQIDSRLWYGRGCHRQPAYMGYPRDDLPTTEDLSPRLIGLPVAIDLPDQEIEEIVAVLARV